MNAATNTAALEGSGAAASREQQTLGEPTPQSPTALAWRRLRRSKVAIISGSFLLALAAMALFTPLLPLESPYQVETSRAFEPPQYWPLLVKMRPVSKTPSARRLSDAADAADGPSLTRDQLIARYGEQGWIGGLLLRARLAVTGPWVLNSICGRDELGRDQLPRLVWGARVSLAVGLVATIVSLLVGVSYGSISGYFGGAIDNLMMRFIEVLDAIPFIFVVIFLMTILGQDQVSATLLSYGIDRMTIFFLVIGAIYWLTMARVVRGQVLALKQEPFVEAARAIGARTPRILYHHIVPNLLSIVVVYLTLTIPRVMLFEAFLSFLGMGVQPPDVSWGLLANQGFRVISPVRLSWWLFLWPSVALGSTLMALNFLGDALRDALDPRLRD